VNLASQQKLSRHCHLMALNTCAHSSKISGREEEIMKRGKPPSSEFSIKKGDQKEPTNYRGIVLQDAFVCLLSTIIGGRLHQLMKKCGMEEQFAYQENTGTNDATYCLRSTLQLRKEHEQDTYLLFIDLIKAFDTANYDLLFAILKKYGTPRALIDVV
jgi:hypothetical protein